MTHASLHARNLVSIWRGEEINLRRITTDGASCCAFEFFQYKLRLHMCAMQKCLLKKQRPDQLNTFKIQFSINKIFFISTFYCSLSSCELEIKMKMNRNQIHFGLNKIQIPMQISKILKVNFIHIEQKNEN